VDEGGPGIIVPGKSVGGIKFGDSRETVEAKLGKPDAGGIVDGLYRAWYSGDYLQGPHAGLSVYFVEIENRPGPVDALGISSPYNGKTKEGIGIGSSLATDSIVMGMNMGYFLPIQQDTTYPCR